ASALFDFLAARSRSITVRQPVLSSARCLNMQAVIFGMFGISSLQRRKASPVHCDCASALKAKLAVEDSAEIEAAKARAIPAWRMVLVKALVMVGSCGPGGPVVCWCHHVSERFRSAVMTITQWKYEPNCAWFRGLGHQACHIVKFLGLSEPLVCRSLTTRSP